MVMVAEVGELPSNTLGEIEVEVGRNIDDMTNNSKGCRSTCFGMGQTPAPPPHGQGYSSNYGLLVACKNLCKRIFADTARKGQSCV